MELVLEAGTLRFIHPLTRWRYLTPIEEHNRAESERSRAESEHSRAESEHIRAELEHNRADREATARELAEDRARNAEHELTKIRAELDALGGRP